VHLVGFTTEIYYDARSTDVRIKNNVHLKVNYSMFV
jgi:hypothetical protein